MSSRNVATALRMFATLGRSQAGEASAMMGTGSALLAQRAAALGGASVSKQQQAFLILHARRTRTHAAWTAALLVTPTSHRPAPASSGC